MYMRLLRFFSGNGKSAVEKDAPQARGMHDDSAVNGLQENLRGISSTAEGIGQTYRKIMQELDKRERLLDDVNRL